MDVFFWAIAPRVVFWTRFEANFRLGGNRRPLFLNGLTSPRVPGQLPFLLSYPVVLLSSLLFGWACGVYALGLSVLVVGSFFLASQVSTDLTPLVPGLGAFGFLIGAGLIVLVIETLV